MIHKCAIIRTKRKKGGGGMRDWESEIRNYEAREEALARRQIAEYERKRRHLRVILTGALIVAVLAAAVTAVVLTVKRGSKAPERKTMDITSLDWVTQDLLPVNEYSRPGTKLEQVTAIVVHYVGNPGTTAQQNRNYFENLSVTHETSASSHFVVGLEGEIIQCVPLEEWSYCSSQANSYSVAIEVCHPDETGRFNEKTEDSLVRLLKWLVEYYDLDREGVIRHYDVTGKICPKYYVDDPDAWEALLDRVFDGESW